MISSFYHSTLQTVLYADYQGSVKKSTTFSNHPPGNVTRTVQPCHSFALLAWRRQPAHFAFYVVMGRVACGWLLAPDLW